MNLASILPKLGLAASMTQDITLLIVIILASFLFGIFIGRSRLVAVLLNAYVAFAIVSVIPASYLTSYTYKLLVLLILIVALTLWGKRLFEVSISGIGSGFMWKIFALSFLEVVMILSMVISIIPKKEALIYVSLSSYGYLIADPMKLIWMAAPLVFLMIIQKR
jgi:hypothetical protein